jgi:formate/nitrite transporter FocA (FNT family)
MYVKVFKNVIIVYIGNIIMCLMLRWLIIFSISQELIDTDNILRWDQKKKKSIEVLC